MVEAHRVPYKKIPCPGLPDPEYQDDPRQVRTLWQPETLFQLSITQGTWGLKKDEFTLKQLQKEDKVTSDWAHIPVENKKAYLLSLEKWQHRIATG